jgi:hypothetical protein
MINVEQSVELQLAGETEVLEQNLPQCQFVHHKPTHDLTWDGTRVVAIGSRRITA